MGEESLTSKLSPEEDLLFALVINVIVILSLIVNGISILLFLRKGRKNLSPVEWILLNLFVQTIFNSLRQVLVIISAIKHEWILNHFACEVYSCFSHFFTISNSTSLVSIAVVRYQAVCRTLDGSHQDNSHRNWKPYICLILIFPVIIVTAPLTKILGISYSRGPAGFYCSIVSSNFPSIVYANVCFWIMIGLPSVALFYCYFSIICKTRALQGIRESRTHMKAGVIRKVVVIIVAYTLSVTPYGLDFLCQLFIGERLFGGWMKLFPTVSSRLSGIIIPTIYVVTNQGYRKEFGVLVKCGTRTTVVNDSRNSEKLYDENN